MFVDIKPSAVAILAGLAATASAITGPGDFCYGPYFSMYNRNGPSLSYQRLDPALTPGGEAAHLHSFDGGANLAATMSTADLLDSTCTTAKMKQDKSLYWNPTLHFKNDTGFYRVPEQYKKIYYKFGDSNVNIKASVFPKDFMMIAGSSAARSEADTVANAGVSWACMNDGGRIDTKGFPSGFTSCNKGFATQLTFPSCWNGDKINPEKPTAHMAYPTEAGTGIDKCPEGFKKARFPEMFIEFWWDIRIFEGYFGANDMPWVLSNGDPTGYGFHADFAMGWEDGVLEKAISENGLYCGCGCGNDEFTAYFGAENVNVDDESYDKCAATPVYPGENTEFLEKLPGCNPLQYGPEKATVVTGAGCSATAISTPKASSSKAATSTVESSAATSLDAASTAYTSKATSVEAADAGSTAAPSALTMSLPGKGVADSNATAAYGTASPTFVFLSASSSTGETTVAAVASSTVAAGEPSAATSNAGVYDGATSVAAGSTAVAVGSSAAVIPTSPSEGSCKAPVYVTVTPTVYVTAGECASTIYTTVTNTATVIVAPASEQKHRRHLAEHLHKH